MLRRRGNYTSRVEGDRGSRISPAALILGASAISGATGYLVSLLVAARVGVESYAFFSVYWSALFVAVGALGGVQQEVTRATSSGISGGDSSRLPRLAAVSALGVFVFLAMSSLLWAPGIFPDDALDLRWSLAWGVASYLVVAVVCGALYGVRAWWGLAAMIVIDGALRLAGVLIVLGTSSDLVALGWAVALPFPLTVLIMLPILNRRLRLATVDVGYRRLGWNVARTVVATAATATLVSGFPLLLRATSPSASAAAIGPLILALTLTRAPIVIPLMSLQSYLIVYFADRLTALRSNALKMVMLLLVGAFALAVLAALIGPGLLIAVFGGDFTVSPWLVFLLVSSSGLIAAMCVSGPAVLARSGHAAFAIGWIVASLSTIVILLLDLPLEIKTTSALVVGPLVGLSVHLVVIVRGTR